MILFLTSSLICFTSLLHIFWSFQNSLCSFKNSKQFLEMSFLFKGLFSNTLSCWPSVLSQQTAFPHFFFSYHSKITADGDCSLDTKRCLLLGRKLMTNLDSILKSRDITLPTKVHLVKAMVFPVVIYGCESWTIKKAESQRINAFELWCWRRLLRVP